MLTLLHIPVQGNNEGNCPAGEEAICEERKAETTLQVKFPELIKRKGDKLIIRSTAGVVHVFKDNRNENNAENYVTHLAQSSLPGLDWVIVNSIYYEGDGQELINLNSGELIQFDGSNYPTLSPNGKHLLVYSQDLVTDYHSNYISIYQIDQNSMKVEVEFSGDRTESNDDIWGPDQPRWVNNETLLYDELRYVGENGGMQATHIRLQFINGQWKKSITGKSAVIINK